MNSNGFSRILNGLNQISKTKSVKDYLIVGLISGAVGSIVIELVNLLLGKKLLFGKLASSMIINPLRSNRLKNILIGELMHLTVGASIGAAITTLLKKTGKDFLIIKGTFAGLLAWIGLHNLGNRMDLFSIKPHSTKNHFFAFIQHVLYGISTSAVIKYLAKTDTFQDTSITKTERQSSERNLEYMKPFSPSGLEPNSPESQVLQYKYPTA
ncbi:MAG TPA: hypothetical protein DEF42_04385 [Desulfosporosinus sp.]|nr:hypothetical protein [Desulfosporosinus sp.]